MTLEKEPWYTRLVRRLGFKPDSKQAHDAVKSTSKHGRARTLPHDYDRKRKIRRKMAAESRRRNRSD